MCETLQAFRKGLFYSGAIVREDQIGYGKERGVPFQANRQVQHVSDVKPQNKADTNGKTHRLTLK